MKVEVEPHDTMHHEGRPEAELFMDVLNDDGFINMYDFDTEEGREEFRQDFGEENDLDAVNLDYLFANSTNFPGISFQASDINHASFVDAKLPLAQFNRSKLVETNFERADLRYASFFKADLTGVDFNDANLTGANFADSNWQAAINLTDNPTFTPPRAPMKILLCPSFAFEDDDEEEIYEGINYMKKTNQYVLNIQILDYLKEIFPEPERKIQRVERTNYYSVNVVDDVVDDIKTWYDTHLAAADARGFVKDRQWVVHAFNQSKPFEHATLSINYNSNDRFFESFNYDTEEQREYAMRFINNTDDLLNAELSNIFAIKTDFTGRSFTGSKLIQAMFSRALLPLTKFRNCDLTDADFQGADLRYADFQGANLTRTNFQGANLIGANFASSNWQAALNLSTNASAPVEVRQLILEEEEAEDDEALAGDTNTCYAVTDLYDKNIDKYLAKDPGNFILQVGDNKECESLQNLKQQYYSEELRDMEGYYECSQSVIDRQIQQGFTETTFKPKDYITDVEYVKVGSYNQYIIKPDWFYDGPAPEPRVFKLVSTGDKKRLISKRIATHANRIATQYGTNVVSDVHCDPKDTFEIFRLEAVFPTKSITRRKRTLRRKPIKKRKNTKRIRKVGHRTRGRSLTAADETNAGGGRKKKRTLKKGLLKKRTLKKRTKRLRRN
jgi:uncharacterized protein YjbI with pentapeptide repeats